MKVITFSLIILFLNIPLRMLPTGTLIVIIAILMVIDLITGIAKAVIQGKARTSSGFKKTVIKFTQYFGAITISVILKYLIFLKPEYIRRLYPDLIDKAQYIDWIGDGLLIFITFIEMVSILENIHEIDEKSKFSRYCVKPLLFLLTIRLDSIIELVKRLKNGKVK